MSVVYGEQQRNSSALSASGSGGQRELERQYHVVLQDSLGHPALGFREGTWFRITVSGPQPLQLRGAIRTCPHAAGSIVQIACWWMRENPMQPRSLDLATELALTVGELVRVCPADGLGTTSMDLLPMAMAAVAQSGPPVSPAPALPGGPTGYPASGSGFGSTPALGSSTTGFGSSSEALYGSTSTSSSASAYGSSSGYGSSSSNGYGQTSGYGSTGTYGSSSTDSYSTSSSSTSGYSSSYSSSSSYEPNAYALLKDPLTDPLVSYTAASDPLAQSGYSSSSYASSGSYDAAQTAYLPAATGAGVAPSAGAGAGAGATNNGWFEPADGTGTGGFPAVPPAPVVGRPTQPAPSASKPYAGSSPASASGRGYQNGATQQAALPPAPRPREAGADWEPRAAAPRRPAPAPAPGGPSPSPSYQPRPQQPAAGPRPVPGAAAQQPRPRPQQPRDGYGRPAEPQDPSRSRDRNGVPPRRPAAAAPQQRGTMGQRPATRPGRPSER